MNSSSSSREVKCPQCGRLALYDPSNAYRPFCSERCKLIDLGQWASEGYKIPLKQEDGYLTDLDSELDSDADDDSM